MGKAGASWEQRTQESTENGSTHEYTKAQLKEIKKGQLAWNYGTKR